MDIQADVNQVISELSNQIAVLSRENAILKSMVSQYQKVLAPPPQESLPFGR